MNRIKVATRFFLKNSLGEMFNNKMSSTLMMLFMGFLVFVISIPICSAISMSYDFFKQINQEGYLLSLILLIGSLTTFLMGIYTVLNVFFFAEDMEILMSMPFKMSEIMISKFIVTLINMYIYTGIIIAPLIVYGVVSKAGVLYYLFSIFIILANPILPLALCLIISLIIMRITNLSKHKDMFKTISGTISIILVVVINFFANSSTESVDMTTLLSENNGLIKGISSIFFTNIFGAKTLLYSGETKGILNLLLLIISLVLLIVALYYIGDKLYFKSIVGMSETSGKRENILEKDKDFIKEKSPIITLAVKDIKIIFRTPTFFINCVVMLLYFPLIIGVTFIGADMSRFEGNISSNMIVSLTMATIIFSIIGGNAATTCLSREGKNIIVSKYIPVSYKTQIKSKILSSVIINSIAILIGVAILLYVKADIITFIMSLIIQVLTIIMVSLSGVLLDYKSPSVNWEDENAMFDKNFRPLILLLVFFAVGGFLTIIYMKIESLTILFIVNIISISVISILIYRLLMKFGVNAYKEID